MDGCCGVNARMEWGRLSTSLLKYAGLEKWIAKKKIKYVEIAKNLHLKAQEIRDKG